MRFPESSDCAPVGLPPIPKCPSRVSGKFPVITGRESGTYSKSRLEDVKKSTLPKFPSFRFDEKCMPTHERSLIRHPGADFFMPNSRYV
jgi:hypothetical protein